MSKLLSISIDTAKIDESRLAKGKYLNISVVERREPDQYGNTHTVYMQQSKEERQARADKIYIGSGKAFVFNSSQAEQEDDLPF